MFQPDQKTKAEKHVEELQKQAHKDQKKIHHLETKIKAAQKKNEHSPAR